MKEEKVIYYSDELNDEFSGIKEKDFKLNDDYKYIPQSSKKIGIPINAILLKFRIFYIFL